jgi:tetratricopeptide (TPR) repeat protein
VSAEAIELGKTQLLGGKDAFERGQYRQSVERLEKAVSLFDRGTALHGEAQIWLVTAYEASGKQEEAIALCEQVSRHPHLETRKEGSRLLYILKAPKLQTRPEWLTQIPDLSSLDADERGLKLAASSPVKPPSRSKKQPAPEEPEPIDLSQINTQDNRFIWVALVAIALTLGGVLWFS